MGTRFLLEGIKLSKMSDDDGSINDGTFTTVNVLEATGLSTCNE